MSQLKQIMRGFHCLTYQPFSKLLGGGLVRRGATTRGGRGGHGNQRGGGNVHRQ
jgi:hypothetical protein